MIAPLARRARSSAIATRGWLALAACVLLVVVAGARAQSTDASLDDEGLLDRPVASVSIFGLERVSKQMVENNIRVSAGQPFDPAAVRADVTTLYRLGQFSTVTAEARLEPNGTVAVAYTVVEQPIIRAITFAGNKVLTDQELRKVVPLYAGGPRDDFLLEQSLFRIKELYKSKGNYLVEVSVDENRLREDGVIIFRIIEGPRVRVRDIEFVGNKSYPSKTLGAQIRTRTSIPIFRKGELDEELLVDDVAAIDRFYKEQGFVDVRVDRRIELSPDSKEAKVTFLVDEGRRYRLRNVIVHSANPEGPDGAPLPLAVLSREQIEALLVIRAGDWYTKTLIDKSIEALKDSYFVMGYIDAFVEARSVRVGDSPEVDMVLFIREGPRSIAGLVLIQGNFLTKDKVIRRLVRIQPGRPLDGRELTLSKDRVRSTGLFNDVRVTAQRARPGTEDPLGNATDEEVAAAIAAGDEELALRIDRQVRDVLVEVKERNTGAVNFGVGIGTDSGAFGEVSITQRNFDIADYPLTFEELITGRAFRGAGQQFALSLAPGTDVSIYSVSFGEPHLFETDLALRLNSFFRERGYDTYTEQRFNFLGGSLTRVLGDYWAVNVNAAIQKVELTNFFGTTPVEVFEDRGPSLLGNVGFGISRTNVDKPLRPTRGTQFDLSISQYYDFEDSEPFTIVRASGSVIFTVDEDYLGRRSTLRLNSSLGYIFGGQAPVYEKFYLGGRSFRGFEFRTVSPKSSGSLNAPTTPNTEPIGGNFLFFVGAQYEVPLLAEFLSGVVFIDSGTVTEDFGLDDYRVSVGIGVRIYIPQLGPTPFAFDFAFPLAEGPGDETQVFSFAAEVPF